jgi:hypothetical protein
MKISILNMPGPHVIRGNYPKGAGRMQVPVRLTDPWGNVQETWAGAKSEYGAGGFEFSIDHQVEYRLMIGAESWPVRTEGQTTLVTFEPGDAPPDEISEPTPPDDPDYGPVDTETMFIQVLEKCDRILELLGKLQRAG